MGLVMLSMCTRPRRVIAVALVFGVIISTFALPACAADPTDLSVLERLVYGKTFTGAFLDRLSRLERDLFGSQREGSIPVRSSDIEFKVSDTSSTESVWLRLRAVEWRCGLPINETHIVERLSAMETYLFGETMTGPIVSRVDDLVSLLFVGGKISISEVVIPQGTPVEFELMQEVSSETAKAGQIVPLQVTKAVVIDGAVVVPVGAVGELVITEASPAGHAFQKAKLDVRLKHVKAVDGTMLTVVPLEGVSADGSNQDATTQLAVGASIAGLALLGPLGAAAGLLIKADQIVLPEGLLIGAAIQADTSVRGVSVMPLLD